MYRVLKRGGYAFLESFQPIICTQSGKQLSQKELGGLFQKEGYEVFSGEYCPDGIHERRGLSLKKGENPRLTLPVSYREIIWLENDRCFKVTYQLNKR